MIFSISSIRFLASTDCKNIFQNSRIHYIDHEIDLEERLEIRNANEWIMEHISVQVPITI
ncbi:MAG: hypothetical protein V1743_05135 [Nanoarchaeota archaeon]